MKYLENELLKIKRDCISILGTNKYQKYLGENFELKLLLKKPSWKLI